MASDRSIPQTGKPLSATPAGYLSWSSVISEMLVRLAKDNKDIVAVTPAMITGQAGKVLRGLPGARV